MARDNDTWSRWVAWLKIVLPLIALAMLSSLFLLSRTIDPTAAIPFSEVDVEDRAREPRLTAPTFSGVTGDGASFNISASDMRPDITAPGRGTAIDLVGRMETPDGVTTTIEAAEGRVDTPGGTFEMTGDVVVASDTGYRITAPRLTGRLDATALDLGGGLKASAPFGEITADSMTLRPSPQKAGQYLLVFNDRVRLVYRP